MCIRDSLTAVYIGGFFAVLGIGIMYLAADILASLTIGLFAIVAIAISLLVRGKRDRKPTKTIEEVVFDIDDMRPVEEFVKDNANASKTA